MKKNVHPAYHEIVVILTNGEKVSMRSSWGKPGSEMRLDIDPDSHPAWQGGSQRIQDRGRVARFNKKFEGLSKI
jgi:large subunit ribosomal protein L31